MLHNLYNEKNRSNILFLGSQYKKKSKKKKNHSLLRVETRSLKIWDLDKVYFSFSEQFQTNDFTDL
jgi:hypothetical protein